MDLTETLADVVIPKMKTFVEEYENKKNHEDYDIIVEFRKLMFDMSDENASNVMVDGIINGDGTDAMACMSEQLKSLFNMLLPEYELSKIEFKDDQQRKNFIDYD